MKALVIDSSVAAKWFPPMDTEPLAAHARVILDRWKAGAVELVVPDILWAELGNILWKCVQRQRCSSAEALLVLHLMLDTNLPTVSTDKLLDGAFRIATTHDRPVYDCLYIALAQQIGAEVITADEKLVSAVGGSFPIHSLATIWN